MPDKGARMRLDSKSYRQLIVDWVAKLATHFHQEQTVEQYEIFLEQLVGFSDWQIDQALGRCLNECTFLPRLAEIRQRIPEQREPRTNHDIVRHGQPVLEINRIVAREISVSVCGKSFDELDPFTPEGAATIQKVMAAANHERLARGWVNAAPAAQANLL